MQQLKHSSACHVQNPEIRLSARDSRGDALDKERQRPPVAAHVAAAACALLAGDAAVALSNGRAAAAQEPLCYEVTYNLG